MDNYDVIVEFFNKADEPLNAGKIAEGTGIDKKEVEKVMNKLKKEGLIVSPKRCYWEIKK